MKLSKHKKEILFSDFPVNTEMEKMIRENEDYADKVFKVKIK